LLSAISDLRGAILENNALRELAALLMERGEYERAYRYLSRASNDAQQYGSRLRGMQVARLTPYISKAYDAERERTQHRTNVLLVIISLIAVLLGCFIFFNFWLLKKRRTDNRKIQQMNTVLSQHNEKMQTLNTQLSTLNTQMKEANRIKDEYIGRFLELCSSLIHRDEERSKRLNRLARDRKMEQLYAELKSTASINEGVRMFHQNFDTAFLNIYPDFISEVNRLMTPENRFETEDDPTMKLTTELRVLALIRLGISDNQKIADILRSSISTIYTYRSKLKSRAQQKDSFEEDIRNIATY
jgi:cell division protein FtsB